MGSARSPASNPLRTFGREKRKTFVFLGRKRKTPGTGLTGQAFRYFGLGFRLGKHKLPESNPLRKLAREIRRETQFYQGI